jgi:hypothetical protein
MSDFVTGQQTPGTVGTPYNLLAFVFGQLMQQIQTVSLVKVLSCTNNGGLTPVGRVSVQPLVVQVSGDNVVTPHGEIADLPYMRLQGGTDAVIIDPKPGDIGVALFCSRDIANVKADPAGAAAAGGATPGSPGMFDWADGLYMGGFLNGNPIQYIRFSAAGIEIVSPTKITLKAPTVEVDASALFKVAAGAVDIEATGDAKVAGATAELQATGAATVRGASVVLAGPVSQTGAGASTFSGSLAVQGTDVHTHHHLPGSYVAGATPVTGNSGNPV